MATSQSNFSRTHPAGYAGQLGDSRPRTVESWEAAGDIGFGLAVVRTADDKVNLGAGTAGDTGAPWRPDNFVGISLRSPLTKPSTEDPTVYKAGEMVSVLTRGTVKVVAAAAVTQGEDVTFNASGQLSSAAAGNVQRTIPGATWATSAASGAIATVRLSDYRLGA